MNNNDIDRRIREKYDEQYYLYDKLGSNLELAIKEFLIEEDISLLTIDYRVKTVDSVLEKIDRKKYIDPFTEIEDFCGLRIICYYRSDINRICELLKNELSILEIQDKESTVNQNEFGYRSVHLIAKIPDSWMAAPNYRRLEGLKIEIQVRTVLMHAWAEIQHKLAYKREEHLDITMRREFSFLSAKLEEADMQFESLKMKSNLIQAEARQDMLNEGVNDLSDKLLNLDTLTAFLNLQFPERKEGKNDPIRLLDELLTVGISIKKIRSALQRTSDFIRNQFEEKEGFGLTRSGMVRTALNLDDNTFWRNTKEQIEPGEHEDWIIQMEEFRKMLNLNG